MKKISLIILIILQSLSGIAQDFGLNPTSPRIGKRESSISSLMRFEDIPANHYTGIPNVTVPICTLPTRSKDISVDLSLGYHPSSVVIYGETAGDCGLGWSLFDGGAISRTTFEKPDEMAISLGQNESNDVYQFNFMGNSGRFYLEKDDQGILNIKLLSNKNSKLVITFTYDPTTYVVNTFTIYDDKGYQYQFTDVDIQTYYDENNVASYSYKSAYHLSKVIDNNGKDLLLYNYDAYTRTVNSNYTDSYKKINEIVADGHGKISYVYNFTGPKIYNENLRIERIELRDFNNELIQKSTLIYDGQNLLRVDLRTTGMFYYEFNYKSNNFPTSGSYQPDEWGYRVYKPTCFFVYPFQNNEENFNSVYYTSGVLNQMRIPSGGSVNFEYESNTYSYYTRDANGNWILQVPHNFYTEEKPENQVISTLAQKEFIGDGSNTLTFTVPGTPDQNAEYFISAETIPFSIPGFYDDQGNLATLHPKFTITGYGFSANTTLGNTSSLNLCLGESYFLRQGQTYTITLNAPGGDNINKKGTIIISKKDLKEIPEGIYYGGGIRIKKIAYFDKNIVNYFENKSTFNASGIFPSKELNYSYNFFENPTRSSGFITHPEVYDDLANSRLIREAVGYKNVTITEVGNGKQQLTFTSPLDPIISSSSPTGVDGIYYDYRRGLLINRKIFSEQNYQLTDTDFEYGYVETITPYINYSNPALNERVGWAKLIQKISRSYFSNSIIPNTITENYEYNDEIRKLTSSTITNSLGETLKTQYSYHIGNSIHSENRIGEVEKIETFRGTDLLFTKKINFSNSWIGNVSFLPNIIQSSKGTQPLENISRITAYDEFSNPLEMRNENGAFVTYLWGYNKTQIIAKIENATNSQVATALGVGNVADVNETNLSAINDLRTNTNLANSMITTYTYKPLIGVSTITDAKNEKVVYEYNTENRVSFIKDGNNKIVTQNIYYDKTDDSDLNAFTNLHYKSETSDPLVTPSITDAVISKVFFDGLGRPVQEIGHQLSNSGKDIVSHIEYDNFGKKTKEYLPYANSSASLLYNPNAKTELLNYPEYAGQFPYSEVRYESSPLNRVLEQAAPGEDWQMNNPDKHTIRCEYFTNTLGDNVKKITATADENSYASLGYYGISISDAGFYSANELVKIVLKNENWKPSDGLNNTIEEYKDKQGRLVLKRVYAVSVVNGVEINTSHDTYMVYDQYGNLTYVLPPKADGSTSTQVIDELCYQYRYDHRNRLVEKKIPGKQWEFVIYDKLNRVVAVGPSLSPFTDAPVNSYGWLIAKYDGLNRKIISAWHTGTTTSSGRRNLQNSYTNTSTPLSENKSAEDTTVNSVAIRYSNNAFPTHYHVLTVDYYDNYFFTGAPTNFSTILNDNSQIVYYNNSTLKPTGLLTGSWKRYLEAINATPVKGELSHVLYDKKARAVRVRVENFLGGYTQLDSKIDFSGKVLFAETKHKRLNNDPTEIYIKEVFTYSPQDRLLTHTHQMGLTGTPEVLAQNSYNELGRLISKKVGHTLSNPLQKVDYSYNIRGWLTEINKVNELADSPRNDVFAFKINYNQVENAFNYTGTPQYNGNISETYWRTSNDEIERKYGYEYDHLNRLKNAIYQKPGSANEVTNSYNESVKYDKNGNIMSLQRNGEYDDPSPTQAMQIDNLTYSYDLSNGTNRLMKVTDSTNFIRGFDDDSNGFDDVENDYSYDANGNLTTDQNKGIVSIKYNHLNQPLEIIFSGSSVRKINFLYTADGNRVQKVMTNGTRITTTDYLGGFQYNKLTATSTALLQFIATSEGYVNNTVAGGVNNYNYIYTYKDHLGNVRILYTRDATNDSVKVLEETNYYPFGLEHTNYNWDKEYYEGVQSGEITISKGAAVPYKYKFNGQERQDDFNLKTTAMDFREYDNATGRFSSIDLLAENSIETTPYHFGLNNPVYWADPSGLDVIDFENGTTFTGDDAVSFFNAYNSVVFGGMEQSYFTISGNYSPYSDITSGGDGTSSGGETSSYVVYNGDPSTGLLHTVVITKTSSSDNILKEYAWGINTTLSGVSAITAYSSGFLQYNELWHKTNGRGYSFATQDKWKNNGAKYWRNQQVKKFAGARSFGNTLRKAGGVALGADILLSGQVKPSHLINSGMLLASGTGVGSIVAGVWFVADISTMGVNYLMGNGAKGLGDMIDNSSWGQNMTLNMYEGFY